ncbi:Histone-lysine N-methyltransferase ATXR2 [Glycine soja]|nr:Histone-lysine N-methyltransferase ATXR2 [Glycine soja]
MDFKEGELVLKDPMLIDCLVCSFCFRFVGSIELEIGRRLYMQQLRANESHGYEEESTQQCTSGSPKTKVPLPEDVVQSLMNGQLVLPFSEKFSLPPAVPCPGGCGEAYYCGMSCAEVDWESSHSLLCTGESSDSARREALLKFIKHANAISSTMLKYRKLKAVSLEKQMKHDISCVSNHCNLSILLEAWKPILMGHKRRWWDCIALPDDVDSSDEASFRLQIKMLAFESLQLLKKAIFDKELFSLEIYGNIIGIFELNNLDLVVASPVEDYFLYIDDLTYPNKEEAEKITQPILDALGEEYSIYCKGTAFFPLQSCLNHSCCRNARAFKRDRECGGKTNLILSTI